jgi:cytochrome c nitrite reductase small subunit
MNTKNVFTALLIIAPAILIGVSVYTFIYAKGYSYMFDNPEECVNCHVMRDNFKSWQVSEHRFATCNDCHVPHNLATKYLVKGENGMRHSFVFTFGNPHNIRLKSIGQSVVQNNCIRCHGTTVSTIFHDYEKGDRRCYDCHRGVGHRF